MSTTFKMTAREFRDWVTPLIDTAGTDDMLPVFMCVEMRLVDGYLIGLSSDRFRATAHRCEVKADGDPFQVLVPVAAIKRLLGVFRVGRSKISTALVFTVEPEGMTVTDHETTMTVRYMNSRFPDMGSLILPMLDIPADTAASSFLVNPDYLGAPAKVATRNREVRVSADNKKVVFRVGDDYLYLLMQRRNEPDPDAVTVPWDAHLAKEVAAK